MPYKDMKRITAKPRKRLTKEATRIIRGMRGIQAQIAVVGHLPQGYVSRVLAGQKPPSEKFLLALDTVLGGIQARVGRAIARRRG
jgi:hypothetical protein